MTDRAAPPSKIPWPPLIYFAALAIGKAADVVYTPPWIGGQVSDILNAAGCLMIVAVVAIYISALRALKRGRTTVSPVKAAEHLVVDGPYAFSRNPVYLAYTMLLIGIGLIAGSFWFIALAIVASYATSVFAIVPEEKHLKARFGKRYLDYSKRVRRWV